MYSFDVKHVPGQQHTVADGLSRRPVTDEDEVERDRARDPDDEIDDKFFDYIDVHTSSIETPDSDTTQEVLDPTRGYSKESQAIATYLTLLRKPSGLSTAEFRRFRIKATKFVVRDRLLFKRGNRSQPLLAVIDDEEERARIISELHEGAGHKGREATYRKLASRYYWSGAFKMVQSHVKSCLQCNLRAQERTTEEMHPTYQRVLNNTWCVDKVSITSKKGLFVAREAMCGWVEAKITSSATSKAHAKFLHQEVFCRHGVPSRILMDGGPENRGSVETELAKYNIRKIAVSAYHPEGNGLVERGHQDIINALSKLTNGSMKNWERFLHDVLWADRTTVRTSTGMTPAEMMYGFDSVLPIELECPTWKSAIWINVTDRESLLAARATQLSRRNVDLEEVAAMQQRTRENNKDYYDERHHVDDSVLEAGQHVLLRRNELFGRSDLKMLFKWKGPYRITSRHDPTGTYQLEELDGVSLRGTFARNRLKAVDLLVDRRDPRADDLNSQSDDHGLLPTSPTSPTPPGRRGALIPVINQSNGDRFAHLPILN